MNDYIDQISSSIYYSHHTVQCLIDTRLHLTRVCNEYYVTYTLLYSIRRIREKPGLQYRCQIYWPSKHSSYALFYECFCKIIRQNCDYIDKFTLISLLFLLFNHISYIVHKA